MKIISLSAFALSFFFSLYINQCFAQDIIYLRSSEELDVKIISESDSLITYSTLIKDGSVTKEISKKLVRSYAYKSDKKGGVKRRGRRSCKLKLLDGSKIQGHVKSESVTEIEIYAYIDYRYISTFLDKNNIVSMKIFEDKPFYGTIGVLKGGGSLIGVDIEAAIGSNASIHIGMGLLGFGCGVNNYFKHVSEGFGVRIAYYHQGIESTFTQSFVGASFIYKSPKGLSLDLGLGRIIRSTDRVKSKPKDLILVYSIGYTFPNNRSRK